MSAGRRMGLFLNPKAPSPDGGVQPLMGDPFDLAAGWLQEHLLIPALYQFGLMNWEDVSYGWALFALYGAAQVAVTFAVCLPLEHWRPVERWPDNRAVWVDVAYTVLSRVGILPLVTYVLFYRAQVSVSGWMADQGWVPPTLEGLFPVLLGQQVLTFVLYAIILDFAEYCAALVVASVPLVVGVAFAAPRAAADDVLVG